MLDSYLSGKQADPTITKVSPPVDIQPVEAPQAEGLDRFQLNRQVSDQQRYEYDTLNEMSQEPASLVDTARAAIETEWLGALALRSFGGEDFIPDPEFDLSKLPKEQDREIFGGLSPEQVDQFSGYLSEATSYEHAREIRSNINEMLQVEDTLASQGMTGVGMRIAASMLDPVAIGATAITEGIAAPAIWGTKLTRLQRMVRAGLLSGATNAGIEGTMTTMDPFRDLNDVAIAGAAGLFLGGVAGSLGRSGPGKAELDEALALASKRAIDDMTIEQGVEAGMKASSPTPAQTVSIADDGEVITTKIEATPGGGGSAGAAMNPIVEDFTSKTDQELFSHAKKYRPVTKDVFLQFDMYSQLARSKHPMVSYAVDLLTPNPSGVRTTGHAQGATAWEIAQRVHTTQMASMYRGYLGSFKQWAKTQGLNPIKAQLKRDEFASLVGRTVRDPGYSADPAVKAAADSIRKVNKEILDMAKKAGVKGFSDVPENASYLMRVHSLERLSDMRARFGDKKIVNMLAHAISKGSDDLDYDAAYPLAEAYMRTVDRAGWNVDMGSSTFFSADQREWLKKELTQHFNEIGQDVSDDVIEEILSVTKKSDDGKPSRAKRRLGMNEAFRMEAWDGDGNMQVIGVQDLFEDNAEVIMESYVRQMAGAIGMAKKGFKGANDFENYVERIKKTGSTVGRWNPKMKKELAVLDTIKKGVMGQPFRTSDEFANLRRVGRALRDYNFARVMGQVGFAQVSEIGNVMGQMGFRATLKHMPVMRRIFKRMQDGTLEDDLQRELEAVLAPGVDRLIDQPMGRYDDMSVPEMGAVNTVDRSLKYANRAVSDLSFMAPINIALERMASRAAVQRFADMASGAGRKLSKKRLLSLGLDDEMAARVFNQMRSYVKDVEGPITGKQVANLNLQAWDDLVARDAFVNAVHRWTRRAVQKNDIGDLHQVMTHDVGKVIFQFRSFMMASWAKQLLHGARMADFETFSSFMGTTVMGALGYALMTYVNSAGRSDQEEFLRDRLDPEKLATAAFYRAGWSSLMPTMIDTGAYLAGTDPIFAYARTTGLATSALGNPTLDLLDSLHAAGRGVIASVVNDDYVFSQQDYRQATRALMFQNVSGVRNVIQMLGEDLPRYSTYD